MRINKGVRPKLVDKNFVACGRPFPEQQIWEKRK